MNKKVYAVTDYDKCPYITAGKRYEVLGECWLGIDGWFDIIDDEGDSVCFSWKGSSTLGGRDWQRIEEPEIDWSQAPEGATHHDPHCPPHWWRLSPGKLEFYGSQGKWLISGYPVEKARNELTPRPDQWDGWGLPPVGTVCEMTDETSTGWVEVEIIAQHRGFSIGWCDKREMVYFSSKPGEFRPIQSERDRVITKMQVASQGEIGAPISATQAINLYDAGYRKMPEESDNE
jgi:hypothetical protein